MVTVTSLPYTGPDKTDQVTKGKGTRRRYHRHTGEIPQEKQAHWVDEVTIDPLVAYYARLVK